MLCKSVLKKYQSLDDTVSEAKRARTAYLKEVFPPGAGISWSRRGHRQDGTVLEVFWDGRIKVENNRTGCEVIITMYDVQCLHGGGTP